MLSLDEINAIEEILSNYSNQFQEIDQPTEEEKNVFSIVDEALILKEYDNIEFNKLLNIKELTKSAWLTLVNVDYSLYSGKQRQIYGDLQLIGIKVLRFNYGHLLIRPETLGDKITELFHHTEIDIKEFPEFSSKYYFISDNEALALSFASQQRLMLIETQKEITIEIINNTLIAKFPRFLNSADFESMLDFIKNI